MRQRGRAFRRPDDTVNDFDSAISAVELAGFIAKARFHTVCKNFDTADFVGYTAGVRSLFMRPSETRGENKAGK
jgi:hypothetical protein